MGMEVADGWASVLCYRGRRGVRGGRDTGAVAAGMGMGTGTGNSCRFGRTGFPRDSYVFGVG